MGPEEKADRAAHLLDSTVPLTTRIRRLYKILKYPIQSGKGGQNRLLSLCYLDMYMFMICGMLFGILTIAGASLEERIDADELEELW